MLKTLEEFTNASLQMTKLYHLPSMIAQDGLSMEVAELIEELAEDIMGSPWLEKEVDKLKGMLGCNFPDLTSLLVSCLHDGTDPNRFEMQECINSDLIQGMRDGTLNAFIGEFRSPVKDLVGEPAIGEDGNLQYATNYSWGYTTSKTFAAKSLEQLYADALAWADSLEPIGLAEWKAANQLWLVT